MLYLGLPSRSVLHLLHSLLCLVVVFFNSQFKDRFFIRILLYQFFQSFYLLSAFLLQLLNLIVTAVSVPVEKEKFLGIFIKVILAVVIVQEQAAHQNPQILIGSPLLEGLLDIPDILHDLIIFQRVIGNICGIIVQIAFNFVHHRYQLEDRSMGRVVGNPFLYLLSAGCRVCHAGYGFNHGLPDDHIFLRSQI